MGEAVKRVTEEQFYRLVPAPPDSLYGWLNAKKFIEKAIERADHWDLTDLLHMYIDGRIGMGLVYGGQNLIGAMVYEVINYPKKRVFYIQGMNVQGAKDFAWFDDIWEQTQALAKQHGCSSVSASGRSGWLRKMPGAIDLNMWEVKL